MPDGGGLDDCQDLFREAPEARDTAKCFYDAAQSGNADRAALLKRLASERPDLPWFTFYAGNLEWADSSAAEARFHAAAEAFSYSGDEAGEVYARISRSVILARMGRLQQLRAEQALVERIGQASSDPGVQAWGRIVKARRLLDSGTELGTAYDLLANLEIPSSMVDAASLERERTAALGRVSMSIGRFAEARSAFESQIRRAVAAQQRYSESAARQNLVWVAYEMLREAPTHAKREEVVALAKQALDVARTADHREAETWAAWYLGSLLPGEQGTSYLRRCADRAEGPAMLSLCLNPLAGRLAATDPEEAERLLARSRALARESGEDWGEVRIWQEDMHVAWHASPPREALSRSLEALDAIEELRDRQPEGSIEQAGMFSIWSDDYAWLAGRLLLSAEDSGETGWRAAEAFRVGERMRARSLSSWLRRADVDAGDGAAEGSRRLEEVQAALAPEEALLSFQVAPWHDLIGQFAGGSWLLAITRDEIAVHRLPDRVELRREAQLLDGLLARRDGSETEAAVRLYDELLAAGLERLPASIERLILVPDDVLHRLPFAALRGSGGSGPLGARYELVQVPAASLWLRWRELEAPKAKRPLLVLADPELPRPREAVRDALVEVAQVRGPESVVYRDAEALLGRLPRAREEGRAALRALGGGLLLSDAEASEAAFRGLPAREFGIVHFATHAVDDQDRPERSAVLLAPTDFGEAPAAPDDGFLRSGEIAHLDLRGRLVVLAACRTASGATLRGEGVMSLARAFFQAGAHTVVASLWPLRDDESAAMFDRFYRHLGRGASVAGALHEARREAIDAGEPAASWAGLVVLGDGSVVPLPGGRRGPQGTTLAALLAASLLLAAVGGWAFRRRFPARRA